MIKKNIIQAFVVVMRYMVLSSLLGPVVGPVACILFLVENWDFQTPSRAITKDTLGEVSPPS